MRPQIPLIGTSSSSKTLVKVDIAANLLGGGAALLTTLANVPQVIKCVRTGRSADLSLKMLVTLSMGLALWLLYGVVRGDVIIALANGTSLALVAVLLGFKYRDMKRAHDQTSRQ